MSRPSRLRNRAGGFSGGGAPWYQNGKADGIDPTLWVDFVNNRYAVNGVEAPFADVFTFTRASTATYFDASGVMQTAAINAPRFDYDPVTLAPKGLLIEEQRKNLVLNSATGTNQSVTVTATGHTLSFYGTGTVTLSGAFAGSLVGTGAYPVRSTLTFTPSAGSLTLTCTGTIQFIQIEAGAFPTSFIETTTGAVTRSGDSVLNSSANVVPFASWYNATEGCFNPTFNYIGMTSNSFPQMMVASDAGQTNRIGVLVDDSTATPAVKYESYVASAYQGIGLAALDPTGIVMKVAGAYKNNDGAVSRNGAAVVSDVTFGIPTVVDRLNINTSTSPACVHMREARYYNQRITNSELQRITA